MKRSLISAFSFLLVSLILTGCGNGHMSDTQSWMEAERNKARPAVQPLPEPKPYVAVGYTAPVGAEPFNMARLVQAINAANANSPTSAL